MKAAYNTEVLDVNTASIKKAATLIKNGQLVGMPTETVYGLAADATNEEAVAKIFAAKGRPQDNPLTVHIASFKQFEALTRAIPAEARRLAETYWPGPLTLVLPHANNLPHSITAGLHTVGVRMPNHPVALALIEKAGLPLAAPSANRSGHMSPTSAQHVLDDLGGKIPLILDAGTTPIGLESTVISFEDGIHVLREGSITIEQLSNLLNKPVTCAATSKMATSSNNPAEKYTHYSPSAELVLVKGTLDQFINYVKKDSNPFSWALCFNNEQAYIPISSITYGGKDDYSAQAKELFSALRTLDANGAQTIYARAPREKDLGKAVYSRLRHAATKIVEV